MYTKFDQLAMYVKQLITRLSLFWGKFANSGLTLAGAVNYESKRKFELDIVQLITNQGENLRCFGENFAMLD